MTSSAVRVDPRATAIEVTADELEVSLMGGRRIAVPLTWFPRLLRASQAQREEWTLLGGGEGIHWPGVDEDVSVAGLLAGIPSQEAAKR
jgi:hypothetical protein